MIETVITSSALILVITGLRYLLRGKISLRLQYALWALVALRLLLPFSLLPSPISIMNVLRAAPKTAAVVPAEPYHSAGTAGYTTDISLPENIAEPSPVLPVGTTPADAPASAGPIAAPQRDSIPVETILTYVWLSGVAISACVMATVNLGFRRRLKKTALPSDCIAAGLPVYLVSGLRSPCLFGVLHPAIFMTPESYAGPEQRRFILTHEFTHYAHKDHLWAYVRCLCLSVYWFNPFVWLAAVLSRRDCELACDEGALLRLGEDSRIGYGRMLVGMMTSGAHPAELLRGATTMTSGKNGIKERIQLIARKPKKLIPALVAAVLISAVAVGCTFTSADSETPAVSTPDTNATANASPSASASNGNEGDSANTANDMTAYIADGSTVEDFAQNYIDYVGEHFQENVPVDHQINIVESKLTGLKQIARFENMTDYPIELWKLEYRLKPDDMSLVMFAGGMSQEGGWITQLGSTGSPVLIVGYPEGQGVYIGNTNTLSIMEEGSAENALRIYLENAGLLPAETYPGSHTTVRFALSSGEVYRLILSQPVRQGETGIWCVERSYSPGGGVNLVTPNSDGEALDTYEQIQADCDNGHKPYLLNPTMVAVEYITNELGQTTSGEILAMAGIDVSRSTDLDESVTAAVIENNRSVRGGDFHTEDHVILKTVVDGRATTVYCIAFYLEYNNEGDSIVSQEPVRITFYNDPAGVYRITSYTDPTDFSSDYAENWARESFPVDIPDEALDLSQYGYQLLNGMEEEQEYIVSQLD